MKPIRYEWHYDCMKVTDDGDWIEYANYRRAVNYLQDIAAMSKKVGSETAAHALAQLGEPRE